MRAVSRWAGALALSVLMGFCGPLSAGEPLQLAKAHEGVPLAADTAATGQRPTFAGTIAPTRVPIVDIDPRRPVPRATRPLRDLSLIVRRVPPRRELTITIGGDLGFNSHMQPVRGDAGSKNGSALALRQMTRGLEPLLDGDLNFANLESIVTERNDLKPEAKAFNFRSHPTAVRHAVGVGFNVLSVANNHTMDFGAQGALDTIAHLDRLRGEGRLRAHAGLGRNREDAGRPQMIDVRGARVAVSAIGIVSSGFPLHRAGPDRPGQLAYQSDDDFLEIAQRLLDARADYRMLSVHQGIERQVQADDNAIRKLRDAAVQGHGIDLVVGHHAHVVQGIGITDGRLIFYGLGNLLHPGMQNMAGFGLCQDYGLLARIHLASDDAGRFAARAVEVIPLTEMHVGTERMTGERARERVQVLNYLAGGLDDRSGGARGLRFEPQADGRGLACLSGAAQEPGRIGRLCRSWTGVASMASSLRNRIAGACGAQAASAVRAREIVEPSMERMAERAGRRVENHVAAPAGN